MIQPAREDDLPEVRRLLERQQLPLDGVDALVETMIVARDGAAIVGTASVELHADGALLRSVVVDPAVQGQGLGHRLTESALRLAEQHGADMVFLLTTTAEKFFPRFGFQQIRRDEVPASVEQSVEFQSACPASAVVMRKRLVRDTFEGEVVPSSVESRPRVRRALPEDAAGIAAVLAVVADERVHSAIDRAWSIEQERVYLESLSPREVIHVATDGDDRIVGLQVLERWSTVLDTMAHVGQVGTFLLPAWRKRGLGRTLWMATVAFAREAGYQKLVIQVRATNLHAQSFYRGLGFAECGRLSRQVIIDGSYDDEILMELFL